MAYVNVYFDCQFLPEVLFRVCPKVHSGSYSEHCVTVMMSNLRDKVVLRVPI